MFSFVNTFFLVDLLLLATNQAQSYKMAKCEEKYVKRCSMAFAKVCQTGDENGDVLKVYCKAYQVSG